MLSAMRNDTDAIVFKVPEAVSPALDKLHLTMEAFGDSIVFVKRHIHAIGSSHELKVSARVFMLSKPLSR